VSGHSVPYRPGLVAYDDGCRCSTCVGFHLDATDMLDRYLSGETLASIGRDYAVTRERVRQIVCQLDPAARRKHVASRERQREAEAERLRAERAEDNGPCRVCGSPNEGRARSATCSSWCSEAWTHITVRRLLDPDQWQSHTRQLALSNIEHSNNPYDVRSAIRTIAGTKRSHGRWLIPGSKAWEVAVRAATERWPTFDQMPEQVQRQVGAYLAEAEGVTA
jgi:hypothetical protein